MIKGTVLEVCYLKPPPRYGAEPLSLMPHTQDRLIQVIYQCSLQKPPSQMLLGQQPAQRKRAWNANCVQTQSGGYDGHFRSASVAFPQKGRGACVGGTVGSLPHVERSASERITPPQRRLPKEAGLRSRSQECRLRSRPPFADAGFRAGKGVGTGLSGPCAALPPHRRQISIRCCRSSPV